MPKAAKQHSSLWGAFLRTPFSPFLRRAKRLRDAFGKQKAAAKVRGIPFLISFNEWLAIWACSGHLSERGRGRGRYQMARHGDLGAYAVGNASIITSDQNRAEQIVTPQARAKISAWQRGRPKPLRTPEHCASISAARKGKSPSSATRAKLSAAIKARWAAGDFENLKSREHTELEKANMRAGRNRAKESMGGSK
jgi:hypothetical protein